MMLERDIVMMQRFGEVAADGGDDAEVLRGHAREHAVAGDQGGVARLEIERLGAVEITASPMDDRLDIDRVAFARRIAAGL